MTVRFVINNPTYRTGNSGCPDSERDGDRRTIERSNRDKIPIATHSNRSQQRGAHRGDERTPQIHNMRAGTRRCRVSGARAAAPESERERERENQTGSNPRRCQWGTGSHGRGNRRFLPMLRRIAGRRSPRVCRRRRPARPQR